jgi:hypothetical protein
VKLKNTYLDALPLLVNKKTGRIHSSFNQTVAATGRLSSSDPNFQNIPIRTELGREIRRAFIPQQSVGKSSRPIIRRSNCGSWRIFPMMQNCDGHFRMVWCSCPYGGFSLRRTGKRRVAGYASGGQGG